VALLDQIETDLTDAFFNLSDFAESFQVIGGGLVNAIYDHPFLPLDVDGVGHIVAAQETTLTLKSSDVTAEAMTTATEICVKATRHRVRQIQDDGTGVTVLALEDTGVAC